MQLFYITLFIFTVIIFVLSAFLIFHEELYTFHPIKRKPKATEFYTAHIHENPKDKQEQANRIMHEICLKWPTLSMMMEMVVLEHSVLFHWRGLSYHHHVCVFRIEDTEMFESIFDTVYRLDEENKIPMVDFWISIPFYKNDSLCYSEQVTFFRKQSIPVNLVFKKGNGLTYDANKHRYTAKIGIADFPFMRIAFQGDSEDYDWLDELSHLNLGEGVNSEVGQFLLDQCFGKKRFTSFQDKMQRLKEMNYDLSKNFYPFIDKKQTELYLYAPTIDALKKAYEILQKDAQKNNIQLSILTTYQGTDPISLQLYRTMTTAITKIYPYCDCIPVYTKTEEKNCVNHSIQTISFAPLVFNKNVHHSSAISFYYHFLCDDGTEKD